MNGEGVLEDHPEKVAVAKGTTQHLYFDSKGEHNELAAVDIPVAPDGGWGWMVLLSSFILWAIIDGVIGSAGVFYPEFLEYFGASRGKTAIIGSMLTSCPMLSGPLISLMISIMGYRVTAMIGGILITIGLCLSVFAPTIEVLIITFGFITGIGTGAITTPAVVSIGYWFDKKRSFAMGLAASGSGFGILIFSSYTGYLLQMYDWKHALILVSCVAMQCIVCGAMLRPVNYPKEVTSQKVINQMNNKERIYSSNKHETHTSDFRGLPAVLDIYASSDDEYDLLEPTGMTTLSTNSCDRPLGYSRKDSNTTSSHKFIYNKTDRYNYKHNIKTSTLCSNPTSVFQKDKNPPCYFSLQDISSKAINRHHYNPMLRKDIFYSGSISSIPNEQKKNGILLQEHLDHNRNKCQNNCLIPMKQMLSPQIMKHPSFIVICISHVLMRAGFVTSLCYITDLGISLNIDEEIAAYCVSIYGIGTIIGRSSAGLLTAIPGLDAYSVAAISLVMAGVFSFCTVLFCHSFVSLAICVGIMGLCNGPCTPLMSVMVVNYLGLDHLTNAFGLISLGKGISTLIVIPIAGYLMDVSGSYTPSFCLTGVLFISAGLLHLLLPLTSKQNRNKS